MINWNVKFFRLLSLIGLVLASSAPAFANYPEAERAIERLPTMILSCYVQAFVMPRGEVNPRNQIIIASEMLEKGLRTDRLLPHDRIKQGSYYVFGTLSETLLAQPRDEKALHELKVKMAGRARLVFLTGVHYSVAEESIRLQGCELKNLF